MNNQLQLNHSILQKDIDDIIKKKILPKISQSQTIIICDTTFYFYPDNITLKNDFITLMKYLNLS